MLVNTVLLAVGTAFALDQFVGVTFLHYFVILPVAAEFLHDAIVVAVLAYVQAIIITLQITLVHIAVADLLHGYLVVGATL